MPRPQPSIARALLFCIAAIWICFPVPAAAQAVAGASQALRATRITLPGEAGHPAITCKAVFFDDRHHSIRVLDLAPPGEPRVVFADAMRDNSALAGINGGFFGPNLEPLGLMVANGRTTGRIATGALTSGVWVRTANALLLMRTAEYQARVPAIQPVELIQAGPFLVDGRRQVAGLEATKLRQRSAVVHDNRHAWMLLSTSPASLAGLGRALARPDSLPGITVVRALNLDGGSSCAWFHQAPGAQATITPPGKPIRNAVAVTPKESTRP